MRAIMRNVITTYILLLISGISLAHLRLETPEYHAKVRPAVSFERSAVESENVFNDNLNPLTRAHLHEEYLPLRSAVESVPTLDLKAANKLKASLATRTFIRDSVESLPDNDESIDLLTVKEPFKKYTEQQQNNDYTSQLTKHDLNVIANLKSHLNSDAVLPEYQSQPYRSDSSFQQIIDPTKEKVILAHNDNDDYISSVGNFSEQTHSDDDLSYYGALAQLKSTNQHSARSTSEILCYITNWAFYRIADGKFVPENLDTQLCTLIIYSFASLDPDHLTIKEFDNWVDIENQFYERIVNTGVPVLIAMGGWTDSAGDKYSRLAADEIKRRVFATNLVGFIQRHNFAGLHLDWNYPKCWQSDCTKGPVSDKPNLTKLLREIRSEFNRVNRNYKLGVAISGYKEIITEAYEFAELSRIVDYMTVMSYDYHGSWERQTGHVSPLFGRANDKYPQYNTDYTMQLIAKLGAQKEKLIMGIPFYGQSFTLSQYSSSMIAEGAPTVGPGEPGEFTKQPGMLAYYEICQRLRKQKWQSGRDAESKSGPYAMFRNQWVGYEDSVSVERKVRYAIKNGFGGVAAWTVDLDDFQNRCCSESFPLLKSINRALGRLTRPPPTQGSCERPPPPVTPIPPVMTTVSSDGSGSGHEHHSTTISTTNAPQTTTQIWWMQPSTTTTRRPQTTTQIWWTQPSTTTTRRPQTTTTTTRLPTTTTRRPITTTTRRTTRVPITTSQPTQPSVIIQNEPTAMPNPDGYYPVVQPSECTPGQFYADRYNCNAYYLCINYGDLRQQFCSSGLHWNANSQNCDWPDSARCAVQSSKPTPSHIQPTRRKTTTTSPYTSSSRPTWTWSYETTTIRTTKIPQQSIIQASNNQVIPSKRPSKRPPISPSSKCREGDYYTHRSCDKYYICVNGVLVPNSCGGNLHWDAIRKTCDWPENVQCLTVKSYLQLSRANLIRTNPSDPCNGEERIPYPNDCKKFLFCLWNRFQGGDCGPGLHFNPAINTCDWPSNAHCTEMDGGTEEVEHVAAVGDNEFVENQFDPIPPQAVPSKKPITRPTATTTRPPATTSTTVTMRPTYPTDKPELEPLNGYYKVVCYFTNWAWYRKGTGRYTPDNINTDLCTHVVYGFAVLDYSNLIIRTHDSWADIDNNFYTRVSGLREKGVKVSLALGGWNDSQGDKYSRLVRNPQSRARFVQHAVEFLQKYGFEGLDLDWEYPVCWQTDCNKGMADEKDGFTALVRELYEAFEPHGLLLSTAVSPSKKIIDAGYDVKELSKYFDWIAVMTYDFHGQWDKKTGHVAPLFYHPDDDIEYFNANFSLNYWIEKGAPSRKIVMGMPLYGQSFTLENAQNNGLNAKAPGPGQAGEFTRAAGFLAYYEICDRIKNRGWEVVRDEQGRMGPYARKGTQWVSFDDPEMIRKKSQLIRGMDLGGGMVWALDLDDFKNVCGDGVHPLLQQIHNVLKDPPNGYETLPGLTPVTAVETEFVETDNAISMHDASISHEQHYSENNSNNDFNQDVEWIDETVPTNELEATESLLDKDYKVVCYFTAWSWYRQNGGKFLPEDIDPDLCTHIIYGFAILDRETLTIRPHDTWADLDNKFYERITAFKAKNIKVSVAIGGWNDSAGDKYSRLVRSLAAIGRFVRHVIEFMEKYGFDGLDLDWEYPVCWQVDCNKGSESEREGFVDLVKELSRAFKPKGYLLSAAVSPNKKVVDAGYNVPELSYYFDWIAIMAYDYHGQWDKKTGHVAPMYDHPMGTSTFNANFTVNYWIESGAEREKLIMGMPLYGQSFSLAQARDNGLNAPTYGGGEAGQATRARGFLSYYEICNNIQKRGWNVVRDPRGRMGPYAFSRDQWVSFDDMHMIRHKSEYIRAMGLGGAMIWALDLDDFRNVCDCESYPLLKTINRVLRAYPEKQGTTCPLEKIENSRISIDTGLSQPYTALPQISENDIEFNVQDDVNIENTELETFDDCESQSFKRHKTDCQKYYICVHGELLEQLCPEGLHWNDHYCDWPKNSNCVTIQQDHEQFDSSEIQSIMTTKAPITSTTKKPKLEQKPSYAKPINKPTVSPVRPVASGDYKIVCYFTAWSWYRPGEGKFVPEDIDENLCTHIVYGFTVLNSNTLTIRTHDSWADIDNKFYERVVAYKKKGIKVTVAIGGWNDSLGNKYSRLVLDPTARERFITNAIEFINKYGFDGLDLDWEYPVCWQVDCSKGKTEEKAAFAEFVRELSIAFKPRGLLLSAAVSPSKKVIDTGYDVPTLAKYFDWIAVMTYDFHGHWDRQTGHVAPLYYVDDDTNEYFNANFSINYWIEKGTPPKKLIMGMPLYGQTFALTESKRNGLNSNSVGPGQAGSYTRASGFLAYYEICEKISNGGWNVIRDPQGRIGPYAYNGNQWVSYDDVSEIRRKSQFLKKKGLGGGMIWALDLDDFKGRCGCGKYPLLQTLNQELRNVPGQRINDCT